MDRWFHLDGTECVAGHDSFTLACAEGGRPVYRTFAVSAIARVRELHKRQDKPVIVRALCEGHAGMDVLRRMVDADKRRIIDMCPLCVKTYVYVCTHCACP